MTNLSTSMNRRATFFAATFFIISSASAQTVEKITSNYIKFIGGERNWNKVKTMTTSGEYDYGGISFPFKTYAVAPDRYKFKVESNGKFYSQAFDGTKGWKIDAFKNETAPTILAGAEAKAMANESDVELLDVVLRWKINGTNISYAGKDSVKSHFCYRIKTFENGLPETFYFDVDTYELVMKKTVSKNAELNKAPINIYYSDYRDIGGIKIPFKTTCESDEQVILIVTVQQATLDQPIDDKEFQP